MRDVKSFQWIIHANKMTIYYLNALVAVIKPFSRIIMRFIELANKQQERGISHCMDQLWIFQDVVRTSYEKWRRQCPNRPISTN